MSRGAVALVVGLVGVLLAAGPAAAHDGDPIITVEATHPADTSVHFVVKMVWENDGDPINDKTVTATPTSPEGVPGAAVTLVDTGDGVYEGAVEMPTPGSWTVTIATPDPVGSITHTEVRPELPPPTTSTTETVDTTEPDEPTEEAAAADQDESADGGAGVDDDSSSSSSALILVAALAVVVLGGLAAVWAVRRNSTPKPPGEPA